VGRTDETVEIHLNGFHNPSFTAKSGDTLQDLMSELAALETLVTHGRLAEARAGLLPWLKKKHLPPELVLPLASLARRAWLVDRAIALLYPRVRPSARKTLPPTPEEKLEYATSLLFVGAQHEGKALLEGIDPQVLPEASFGLGLARFGFWDWSGSLPLWTALAKNPRATALQRLRGRLYHAVALTHGPGQHEQAIVLCDATLAETSPVKNRIVYKSALLTRAQALGMLGRSREATPLYDRIDALCAEESDERFAAHSLLWRAIGERDRAGIARGRAAFFAQASWEQVRMADYHDARLASDRAALARLWYGTPFPAFRALIERETEVPAEYAWRLGEPKKAVWIEASNGRNSSGEAWLKEGSLPQRLLASLASDFYARPRIAQIHEALHPGFYDGLGLLDCSLPLFAGNLHQR
jgi:hypothetical protein